MEENQNPSTQTVEPAASSSPVQTPPNIPVIKPKSKFPLAIIIGIILFLLIAGGAAGFYVFKPQLMSLISKPTPTPSPIITITPTTDPTANWKTYANSAVGFEIKYPLRYQKPALPSGLGPIQYADGAEDNNHILFGEKTTDSFGLQVFPYTGNLSDLIKYNKTPSSDGNTSYTLIKQLEVDGEETLWYESTPPTVYPGDKVGKTKIAFMHAEYGFIFDFNLNHDEEEMSQILSTFKFVE